MTQKVGRPRRYYWRELFAQGTFTLRKGTNYACSDDTIKQQVRNAASHLGKSVKIVQRQNGIKVTVEECSNG